MSRVLRTVVRKQYRTRTAGSVALIVVASAVMLVFSSGSSAKAAADPTSDQASHAIQLRTELGLRSDAAFVQSIESNPKANRSFGIAMTSEEVTSVQSKQDSVTKILPQLTSDLETTATFAGLYFDFPTDVLTIQTTGDGASLNPILDKYADSGVRFRVQPVGNSEAELSALQAEITGSLDSWRSRGVQIVVVGVDVKANDVEVTVANLTDSERDALVQPYGSRVSVAAGEVPQAATCNSRTDCGSPMKGGLEIVSWAAICTSGFVFRDIPYPGAWYVSTAGHCINDAGIGANWTHHGSVFGTGSSSFYYSGSSADVGYTVLSAVASPGNQLMAIGPTDVRSITSWDLNSQQIVGVLVCRAGETSGYGCGLINATDQDSYVSGTLIHHLWKVNFGSNLGDSGGPFFEEDAGYGSLVSTITGGTYYSTLEWIYDSTGKEICTSSSC